MDKEINQLIENRKQYLDRQKIAKSPSKVQWDIYRNKEVKESEFFDSQEFGDTIELLSFIGGGTSLFIGVLLFLLKEPIGIVLMPLGLVLLILWIIIDQNVPLRKLIPTRDNKLATMSEYRREQYSKLHRLIYVKGEFYRVWYVRYVLGLDEHEFERTDKINKVLNRTYSWDRLNYRDLHTKVVLGSIDDIRPDYIRTNDTGTNDKYTEELDKIRGLKYSANSDRENWLNGMATTRFLDYNEFMKIIQSEQAVKEVKELDSKVSQFEYYMNNKERFKNKEG